MFRETITASLTIQLMQKVLLKTNNSIRLGGRNVIDKASGKSIKCYTYL